MIEMSEIIIWLVLFVGFVVAEALTLALVSIWFACGSLVALILAYFGVPLVFQILSFVVVTSATLVYFVKVKDGFLKPKMTKTNLDAVVGSIGLVTKEIKTHELGKVFIQGKEWSAISNDKQPIEKDVEVLIKEIVGVKLIVERRK